MKVSSFPLVLVAGAAIAVAHSTDGKRIGAAAVGGLVGVMAGGLLFTLVENGRMYGSSIEPIRELGNRTTTVAEAFDVGRPLPRQPLRPGYVDATLVARPRRMGRDVRSAVRLGDGRPVLRETAAGRSSDLVAGRCVRTRVCRRVSGRRRRASTGPCAWTAGDCRGSGRDSAGIKCSRMDATGWSCRGRPVWHPGGAKHLSLLGKGMTNTRDALTAHLDYFARAWRGRRPG